MGSMWYLILNVLLENPLLTRRACLRVFWLRPQHPLAMSPMSPAGTAFLSIPRRLRCVLSKLALVLPHMVRIAEQERPPAGYLVPVKSNKLRKIYP